MVDWKDIVERATKTFWQAAVAALPATLTVGNLDEVRAVVVSAVIAAGAAVISFVGNTLVQYFGSREA
jgi:hypothetical protein